MADMLVDGTRISVYLGYGWFSPDDSDVNADDYEARALGVAREVCDCPRKGFQSELGRKFFQQDRPLAQLATSNEAGITRWSLKQFIR